MLTESSLAQTALPRQRIDKWLWFARLVKSRTLAQKLAVSGRVRVNREKCDSASHALKAGDVLTIAFDRAVKIVKVLQLGTRRAPSTEARLLYEDMSPPPTAGTPPATSGWARPPGSGRPTKRDQRRLVGVQHRPDEDFSSGED
jgi:ribosome-associated heat shock protein Hsp15